MAEKHKTSKRLYRSREEKIIAGVCGGIANYFGVDPVWVRVLFVILLLFTAGLTAIIYMVMWFIVPLEPKQQPLSNRTKEKQESPDNTD